MSDVFHRKELAHELALKLMDPPLASAVRSGLFLAAPRRTGKSTFLVADLVPALENANARVIYVDLWRDIDREPADVIIEVIAAALSKEEGALARLTDVLRKIDSVSAGGLLSVSVKGPDETQAYVSMTDALIALSDEIEQVIVLIIDEAQHAITTKAGSKSLFSLKAARDALNINRTHGLRIVATGSNRDKLSMLRSSKDQAFFGAPLTTFPPLNEEYVRWFIEGRQLSDVLEVDVVTQWFIYAGHRPEILSAAADAVLYEIGADPTTIPERLKLAIEEEVRAVDEAQMRVVRSLTALQSAVLREMASSGTGYAPFEQATMDRYQVTLHQIAPSSTVLPNDTNVQSALASLQKRGLVWRAARGVYALEDSRLATLMQLDGMIQ